MKIVNFKKYYVHITTDIFHDVPDEVFNILEEYRKAEQAYYSLDRGDGIEHSSLFVSVSPDEIYERKLTREQLHTAFATLPDKQEKRIYAHYFLGMCKTAIVKAEGVNKGTVEKTLTVDCLMSKSF